MKKFNFTGVVINRRNSGEADKYITLFSRQLGKITLKAAGIRKITSRRAGSLELFNLIKGSAVSGRGQSFVLTEVELIDSHSVWKGQFGRVNLAYQICEAVDRLTPEWEAHPEVFDLLSDYLNSISTFSDDWQSQTSDFLLHLLVILGFWPEDKTYSGDIYSLIESITNQKFHSPKLLRYKKPVTDHTVIHHVKDR